MLTQSPQIKRQKQRVALLQKKLEIALKQQKKVEEEVTLLSEELAETKLHLIRKELDHIEKNEKTQASQFEEEREILYQLIQSGSSKVSFEAQCELDRILRWITLNSEEELFKASLE